MNARIAQTSMFLLIVSVSLILGFCLPLPLAKKLFETSGYYFIFVAFIVWAFTLFRKYRSSALANLREYSVILLLCILITGAMFFISPPEYKVLTDEANLIGTSMMMHLDKIAAVPVKAVSLTDGSVQYEYLMDRRPLFFPFLISIVHAIIGFSAANGFAVNFVAGVFILFTFYLLASRIFTPSLGIVSILMVAGMPQYMFCITSSGFDSLNLLFIILSIFMLQRFLKDQRAHNLELFLFTLLLLAYCRYESVLFIICLVLLIPFITHRDVVYKCSIAIYGIPLMLIPVLWQRRYFESVILVNKIEPGLLHSPEKQFSLSHLMSHAPKNVFVLLGVDPNYGFTLVVAVLAVSGMYLMGKRVFLSRERFSREDNGLLIYGIVTFSTLFCLISAYFWGNFTLPVNNRLSLIFLPCMVFPALYFLAVITFQRWRWVKQAISVLFIFHLVLFWPFGIKERLGNTMMLRYEYQVTLKFLEDHYERGKNLIIANYPQMYIIQNYNSVDFRYANTNYKTVFEEQYDGHVIALQRYRRSTSQPFKGNELPSSIIQETITELNLSRDTVMRISEVNLEVQE